MSSVIRLKTGHAAAQVAPPGESLPGAQPHETTALSPDPTPFAAVDADEVPPEWANSRFSEESHLVPCPRCGSPNGMSASSCWSCETVLSPLAQFQPEPATSAAHAPTHPPTLTPALHGMHASPGRHSRPFGDDPYALMALPQQRHAPAAARPATLFEANRRKWIVGAAVIVASVVGVGIGTSLRDDAPAPPGAARSSGIVRSEPLGLDADRPTDAVPSASTWRDTAGTAALPPLSAPLPNTTNLPANSTGDAALSTDADALGIGRADRALRYDAAPPTAAGPLSSSANTVRAAAARSRGADGSAAAGRYRGSARQAAAAPAAAPRYEPATPVRAPASPPGPCTANVAALGLCSAPAAQPKE